MAFETPTLSASVLDSSLQLDTPRRIRWYMCTIVNLSALNYPDVIPQVYDHFSRTLLNTLPPNERLSAVQRLREGLIKSVGIAGAARTGTAMRTLSNCIPAEYQESRSPRSEESEEVARTRGRKFWSDVYARNTAFDPQATVKASPDYTFIIRDLLYARVFSYDGILDPLETGYAMVAGLYGVDCPIQQAHHMKGMMFNGATREDLEELRDLCVRIADALGVKFRYGPCAIPDVGETVGRS